MIHRAVLPLALALLLAAASRAAERPLQVGDPAPPLRLQKVLQAPEGARLSWDALRGKVVLLEFWGTWCQPCLPAMEHLDGLAGKLARRPFQVVAITTEREEPVARYLKKNPSRLWIGLDDANATWNAYRAGPIPFTVLVDPQGRIAAVTHPLKVTVETVEDLLAGRPVDLPAQTGDDPPPPPAAPEPAEEGALFEATLRPAPVGEGSLSTDSTGRWISLVGPARQLLETAYRVPRGLLIVETDLPPGFYAAEVRLPERDDDLLHSLLQQMIQASLKLKVTREVRDREVLVLATIPGKATLEPSRDLQTQTTLRGTTVESNGMEIAALARFLGLKTGMPVLDETGLKGKYALFLDWDPEQPGALERELEKLGLKLVRQSRTVEMVIVRAAG